MECEVQKTILKKEKEISYNIKIKCIFVKVSYKHLIILEKNEEIYFWLTI